MTRTQDTQTLDLSQTADRAPLPPADATVKTIACEYCPVACGYKVYTWPLGADGGPAADDNALGTSQPSS